MKKILIALAVAALSVVSCADKNGEESGSVAVNDLVVTFDKSVIKSSGDDVVTFRAFYKGEEVSDSEQASFFRVTGDKYEPLTSRSFSTETVGAYKFQVAYLTEYSDVITINAIDCDIPSSASDPQEGSTSFVHRTFFNQHTGANCPNCPFMTYLLRQAITDGYEDKVVLSSLRNYSGENGFATVPNPVSSWPYLHIDYATTWPYNGGVAGLRGVIDERTSSPAKAGIAGNAVYYEENGQIVAKVTVKAAETAEYNVGLWLMQDNFYKKQTVDNSRLSLLDGTWGSDYNYHDNCVRVAESKYLGAHVGYPLGTIQKGDKAEWIFLINVNESWWEGKSSGVNLDDLRFAAFVTTRGGATYEVVNAIQFPYNGSKPFEYID